jgi:hypothetical protein
VTQLSAIIIVRYHCYEINSKIVTEYSSFKVKSLEGINYGGTSVWVAM